MLQSEILNDILNQFVLRCEGMKFDEVIAFFELFIKFSRQRGKEGIVGE